jgi:ubiquinone/menaquinone biosynthesis C-methylase UbiE
MSYGAKLAYQSSESAATYERRPVYSGLLGRMRGVTERRAIGQLVAAMEPGSTVLDCPCGNGRWFEALSARAKRIVARDVSSGMVAHARTRSLAGVEIDVAVDDAEKLDLAENAVDYTFSFALMKHLPIPVQYRVLREFARVSRKGVMCSFAVFHPVSFAWWSFRKPSESYPVAFQELELMAAEAGLRLERVIKISQPLIGLEYFAVFKKAG